MIYVFGVIGERLILSFIVVKSVTNWQLVKHWISKMSLAAGMKCSHPVHFCSLTRTSAHSLVPVVSLND